MLDFSFKKLYTLMIFMSMVSFQKYVGLGIVLWMSVSIPSTIADESVPPPGGVKKVFGVTGYYSPLPGQSEYALGSYEADIRMNGRGTNGADGTEVYPGMLAAPYTYPFGTKIFLPGFGVGTVHDRGGAIVPAGQRNQAYDRIDVWMGRGEDGLFRALNWGLRVVEGIIYLPGDSVSTGFSFQDTSAISLSLPSSQMTVSVKNLSRGDAGESVKNLQKNLFFLGYYSGAITGVYDEPTEKSVVRFQLDNGVIPTDTSPGAGNFGPKTRQAYSRVISDFQKKQQSLASHLTRFLPAGMSEGSQGKTVSHLHNILEQFGYYSGDERRAFDQDTKTAVREFQLAHGVIDSPNEYGAGVFGPKTQKKVFDIISKREQNLRASQKPVVLVSQFSGAIPVEEIPREPQTQPTEKNPVPAPSLLTKSFPEKITGNAVAASEEKNQNQVQVAAFGAVE
jgi:peptidoglycan hydrolase-like protein with peptidoglycan-binding domain/3D (Asp-Asp-Asp) domain-containing protein